MRKLLQKLNQVKPKTANLLDFAALLDPPLTAIDSQLSFEKHINTIFGKAKVKLSYQIIKFISWLLHLSLFSKIYSIFTRKPRYKFV